MENEKLSQSFIQKYDPLTDSFVVVKSQTKEIEKRKFEPFSFFKFHNRSKALQDSDSASPSQPPETLPLPPQNAVTLSRDAYNRMRILCSLYETMANSDPKNATLFSSLASEMLILENNMLSIYQVLSGNNYAPAQTFQAPILTGNICVDLATIGGFLQDTIDTVIALQRSVNVADIDRQLAIINATLLSHQNKLNALQYSCLGGDKNE